MALAPRILVRRDVLAFGEVSRARVLRGIQIAAGHRDAMGRADVTVPIVIVCGCWVDTREGVPPPPRSNSRRAVVQARRVRVGAPWTKMRASGATTRVAGATNAAFQCRESVFPPGLADLLEAIVVIRAAAHPIKVLRNERVIGIWQCEPVQRLVAVVTRSRSYP